MQPRMIFHHPNTLPLATSSGSQVRIRRMSNVFAELGYQVKVVAGRGVERSQRIEQVKQEVEQGVRYEFLYSESTSGPSSAIDKEIQQLFRDFNFLRWCKKQSIPVGLFYRDLHWRFGLFSPNLPQTKRLLKIGMFWYDWLNYLTAIDHLFLPSLLMAKYLPTAWPDNHYTALFPGCDIPKEPQTPEPNEKRALKLLYVGGIIPPLYDLKSMFNVVEALNDVELTICCRNFEWEHIRSYYEPFDHKKIKVLHLQGKQLDDVYQEVDLFGLVWKPYPYLAFAMPVKVFETLGHAVPIITTAGTEVARFVEQEGIGWVVANEEEFSNLLKRLQANRQVLREKQNHLETVRLHHTWQSRAQTVADTLKQYSDL